MLACFCSCSLAQLIVISHASCVHVIRAAYVPGAIDADCSLELKRLHAQSFLLNRAALKIVIEGSSGGRLPLDLVGARRAARRRLERSRLVFASEDAGG